MPKFAVELRHTLVQRISLEIEAPTEELAKELALAEVDDTELMSLSWEIDEDEVAVNGVSNAS